MQLAKTALPLTPKVGTIEDGKFDGWSGAHATYQRTPVNATSWQTDKMASGSFTFDEMVLNRTVCKTMMNKNKSLVEFKGRVGSAGAPDFKKTLAKSSSMESFVDYRKFQSLMKEYGSNDQFYTSFQRFLKPKPYNPSYRPEVISAFETDFVVKNCLGDDAPEFILYKVREFGQSVAIQGEITWDEFRKVLDRLHIALEAEAKMKRDLPGLVVLMNKPRTEDKGLKALGEMSSTYRDSFSDNSPLEFAGHRPEFTFTPTEEEVGAGLNNTAKALCSGTTTGTYHIPGFRGHIPANMRNPVKFRHGMGKEAHPVYNNLVLSQRGMGCVLGYSGHVPLETRDGQYHERKTSCDPRTSNGAAYSGIRTML